MTTEYFDREGGKITRSDWALLRENEDYCTVRRFDNGKLRIGLTWVGRVDDGQNYMPSYRPLFRIDCLNRVLSYEGEPTGWAVDPDIHLKSYSTESAGIGAYETFLERWTKSGYTVDRKTGDKRFVEVDNIHTPPPPPDPDAPSISNLKANDCDEVGVW